LPESVETLTCTLSSLRSAALAAFNTDATVACLDAAPAREGTRPAATSERAGRASRVKDILRAEIMAKA